METETSLLQNRLKEFEQVCREKGVKLTHQRMEIFREVLTSKDHPSAEEIHKQLKKRMPTISLDTVYRTLATLEDYKIINKFNVLDDRGRFDANLTPHHHLVCTRCKGIKDFYWTIFDGIQLPPETKDWGQVHYKQVELRGICEDCLRKNEKA